MATNAPTDYPFSGASQNAIDYVYEGELGRGPDQSGAVSATAFLTTGGTLAQLRLSVATSPEAQADLTADYQGILGRAPDSVGLQGFTQFLATADFQALYTTFDPSADDPGHDGVTMVQTIPYLMAHSGEAQADIAAIYQAELGRAPDTAGAAAFTAALAEGFTTLAAIRISVAGSGEAQQDITQAYVTELGRQPDAAGLVGNTLYLAGGGTLANLHAAFATGKETNMPLAKKPTTISRMPTPRQGIRSFSPKTWRSLPVSRSSCRASPSPTSRPSWASCPAARRRSTRPSSSPRSRPRQRCSPIAPWASPMVC